MKHLWTVVAIVLLAGGAQAQALPAQAAALSLDGSLEVDGDLAALLVRRGQEPIQGIFIHAKEAQMLRWTNDGVYASCVGSVCPPRQSVLLDPEPETVPADGPARDVRLSLAAQPDLIHKLAFLPSGPASLAFQGARLEAHPAAQLCLTERGFTDGTAGCDAYDPAVPGFSQVLLEGPLQQLNASHGQHIMLRGDLVLEMEGVHLRDGEISFDTRETRSGGAAGTYERPFGRLVLTDAFVRIMFAGDLRVEWAMQSAEVMSQDGRLEMRDASGTLMLREGPRHLSGDGLLTGDFLLRSDAGAEAIAFDVEPRQADGSPFAASAGSVASWSWLAAGGASLLPLVGIALLVQRHQAHTSMRDVEAALQRGRYGRATRLSRRILRHDPLHESARLSHAIALTRAGRADEAVDGVRDYLSSHQPSDGTLHYVMGMALLDLERRDEARDALRHAAHLTPSLLPEIAPELRPAQDDAYT